MLALVASRVDSLEPSQLSHLLWSVGRLGRPLPETHLAPLVARFLAPDGLKWMGGNGALGAASLARSLGELQHALPAHDAPPQGFKTAPGHSMPVLQTSVLQHSASPTSSSATPPSSSSSLLEVQRKVQEAIVSTALGNLSQMEGKSISGLVMGLVIRKVQKSEYERGFSLGFLLRALAAAELYIPQFMDLASNALRSEVNLCRPTAYATILQPYAFFKHPCDHLRDDVARAVLRDVSKGHLSGAYLYQTIIKLAALGYRYQRPLLDAVCTSAAKNLRGHRPAELCMLLEALATYRHVEPDLISQICLDLASNLDGVKTRVMVEALVHVAMTGVKEGKLFVAAADWMAKGMSDSQAGGSTEATNPGQLKSPELWRLQTEQLFALTYAFSCMSATYLNASSFMAPGSASQGLSEEVLSRCELIVPRLLDLHKRKSFSHTALRAPKAFKSHVVYSPEVAEVCSRLSSFRQSRVYTPAHSATSHSVQALETAHFLKNNSALTSGAQSADPAMKSIPGGGEDGTREGGSALTSSPQSDEPSMNSLPTGGEGGQRERELFELVMQVLQVGTQLSDICLDAEGEGSHAGKVALSGLFHIKVPPTSSLSVVRAAADDEVRVVLDFLRPAEVAANARTQVLGAVQLRHWVLQDAGWKVAPIRQQEWENAAHDDGDGAKRWGLVRDAIETACV
eukprot:gene4983-34761_t